MFIAIHAREDPNSQREIFFRRTLPRYAVIPEDISPRSPLHQGRNHDGVLVRGMDNSVSKTFEMIPMKSGKVFLPVVWESLPESDKNDIVIAAEKETHFDGKGQLYSSNASQEVAEQS